MVTDVFPPPVAGLKLFPLDRINGSALTASYDLALLDDRCLVLLGSDRSVLRKGG